MAIAILMTLTPIASALTPRTATAPYKNTQFYQAKGLSSYGTCKATTSVTSAAWVPKTGNVTAVAGATAKGCTMPWGNGIAQTYASDYMQVLIPFKIYKSTHFNLSVNISFSLTLARSSVGSFACPRAINMPKMYTSNYCTNYTSVGSSWGFQLYDQTNNTFLGGPNDNVVGPQNYTNEYNSSYCSSGSCYYNNRTSECINSASYFGNCVPWNTPQSGSNTTWINTGANCASSSSGHCYTWNNWTLNPSDKFFFDVWFNFWAQSNLVGYPGGNSIHTAMVAAGLGNVGWKITSVTVT